MRHNRFSLYSYCADGDFIIERLRPLLIIGQAVQNTLNNIATLGQCFFVQSRNAAGKISIALDTLMTSSAAAAAAAAAAVASFHFASR